MGSAEGALKAAAKLVGVSESEYRRRIQTEKWCSFCKDWRAHGLFTKDRSRSDGLSTVCQVCRSARNARDRPRRRERDQEQRPVLNEKMRAWRADNPERAAQAQATYRAANRTTLNEAQKARYRANPEKYKEASRRNRLAKFTHYLVVRIKRKAALLGIPFNLEPSDITVPERCPVLGIELTPSGRGQRDDAPSLDRIRPEKGYVKGNVQIVSMKANRIKNDATIEELEKVLAFMRRTK